jgi:glycosyltransferase involved in cell wall biosynthesis
MIEHGKNGLLVDFFDVEKMADMASQVLDAPQDYKHLGQAGVEMIQGKYSLEICLPQMLQLYEEASAPYRGA